MTKLSRRAMLGGMAAATLPVALPEATAGMDDVSIVRFLVEAHKAAERRFWDSPQEIWDYPADEAKAISDELHATACALCSYRPTTIDGVYLKSGYMMSLETFVGGKNEDSMFTHAELVSGFLPPADA